MVAAILLVHVFLQVSTATLWKLGLHSCYTRATLGMHSCYTRATLGLHSGCTRAALGLHSGCTRAALGLHSGCTRATLGLHSGCTRATLGLYSCYTRAALGLHCVSSHGSNDGPVDNWWQKKTLQPVLSGAPWCLLAEVGRTKHVSCASRPGPSATWSTCLQATTIRTTTLRRVQTVLQRFKTYLLFVQYSIIKV